VASGVVRGSLLARASNTTSTTRSVAREYTPTSPVSSTSSSSSSRVSLSAASSTDSPRSTNPPGNVHRPAPGSNPRLSRMILPRSSRGIAHATGFGLKYAW
jgi:hypothetical protein